MFAEISLSFYHSSSLFVCVSQTVTTTKAHVLHVTLFTAMQNRFRQKSTTQQFIYRYQYFSRHMNHKRLNCCTATFDSQILAFGFYFVFLLRFVCLKRRKSRHGQNRNETISNTLTNGYFNQSYTPICLDYINLKHIFSMSSRVGLALFLIGHFSLNENLLTVLLKWTELMSLVWLLLFFLFFSV